jgi:formylglycine-generating enzyme required for sulfatase activity
MWTSRVAARRVGWFKSRPDGALYKRRRGIRMKWGLVLLGLVTTSMAAAVAPADFYVSTAGNDAWSGSLPAPNAAGTDGPFATVARARDAVRETVRAGLEHDVTVNVRGGTYYMREPLLLGPEDSGTAEHAVTYAAYSDEEVWLVGGVPLTEWRRYRDAIRVAAIPEGIEPRQVFENGRRMDLARAPDTGYYRVAQVPEAGEHTGFTYEEGDLSPENWDLTGATVYIWPTHDWSSHEIAIDGIEPDTRTIALRGRTGAQPGNRYFVQNLLEVLDRPGECRIDLEKRLVYCWPRRTPFENQVVVASCANPLIAVRGEGAGKPVRNLHFRDLNLSIANGAVVQISNAQDCSIQSCLVENGGGDGVSVTGHAAGVDIRSNLIRQHGANGVALSGLGSGPPADGEACQAVVENNHIHHCGRLVGHGAGVVVIQSGHNRIAQNDIHHMKRYGTSIKGGSWGQVPWETHWDHLHARNNVFAYNHIHHVNLDTQDTGAMECYLAGRDNVYDHNLIHDTGNDRFGLQSGIYIDDASDYFTVTNNVIYGVHGAGGDQCIFVKGIGNVIENNVLVVAPDNDSAIRSYSMGGHCYEHEYKRNIIVFEGRAGAVYDFNDWIDNRVTASDDNLFWKASGALRMRGGPARSGKSKLGFGSLDAWLAAFDGRFDQHSVVADPLFADPSRRDYRLKKSSPAPALGFEPIDTLEKAGLTADFPKRLHHLDTREEDKDEKLVANSIGMWLKRIEPGTFTMGSASDQSDDDEQPVHEVTISQPFYMGVYEVTQGQYEDVMGTNPSRFEGPRRPVEQVSWEDAREFCRRLSEREGATYRLPTEAEWEYACRAGTQTIYYWGDAFDERYAWASPNSGGTTHKSGATRPNPWGLCDMSGNVWEWCDGWYAPSYADGPATDPKGPRKGTYRVLRGGDWDFGPRRSRSAQRYWQDPGFLPGTCFGFRVVRTP